MQALALPHDGTEGRASSSSAVADLFVYEYDRDLPRVALPRAEIQLVVRIGPSARNGLDVYAFGIRQTVHRKLIRGGQRMVTARLRMGTAEAVLGASATTLAGRVIALEDLWGESATRRLSGRLARARDAVDAAAILEGAIARRASLARGSQPGARLALDAAGRLATASVNAVALDLGVSERHLRRVFREAVGMGPKSFARLTRFHRALRVAREDSRAGWASIAAAAGYYDQAHLIAEFRAIAGVTPRALLRELRVAWSGSSNPSAAP